MQKHIPTYDEALSLFKEFNQSESLLKHAYTVEGVMRRDSSLGDLGTLS